MVVVDMASTRARILKRSRRMHKASKQRLQRAARSQHAEIRKMETARKHRASAVQRWMENQKMSENQTQADKSENSDVPSKSGAQYDKEGGRGSGENIKIGEVKSNDVKKLDKCRLRVRFAPDVLVAQIPTKSSDKLPPPTPAPIGSTIKPAQRSPSTIQAVRAAQLISKLCAVRSRRRSGSNDDSSDDDEQLNDGDIVALPDSVDERNIPLPPRMVTAHLLASISDDDSDDEEDDPNFVPLNLDDSCQASPDCAATSIPGKRMKTRSAYPRPRRVVPMCLSLTSTMASAGHGEQPAGAVSGKRPRVADANGCDEGIILADSSPVMENLSKRPTVLNGSSSPTTTKRKEKRRKLSANDTSPTAPAKGASSSGGSSSSTVTNRTADPVTDVISKTHSSDSKSSRLRHNNASKEAVSNVTSHPAPLSSQENEPSMSTDKDKQLEQDRPESGGNDNDDNDIDNLFATLVKVKAANKASKEAKAREDQNEKRRKNDDVGAGRRSPVKPKSRTSASASLKSGARRYTEEGFRIMSMEEIASDQPPGLNGSCPFDCSCCF